MCKNEFQWGSVSVYCAKKRNLVGYFDGLKLSGANRTKVPLNEIIK